MATVLNVLGLSVAFAAFTVIMMQLDYESRFDKCHATSERIFRAELAIPGVFAVSLPRAFVEDVISSSPHIEAGTLLYPFNEQVYYSVEKEGRRSGFHESVITCLPGIVDVFDFPVLEGDRNCLYDPEKVLIPESLAHKLFGSAPATGKSLHLEEDIETKGRRELVVGAVYRDFPENTQIKNAIYTAIDSDSYKGVYDASNFICYLLLDNASSAQAVTDHFNATFDFGLIDLPGQQLSLTPLTAIYYGGGEDDTRLFKTGNAEVSRLLFLISLLIIVIAVINYVNFGTSLAPMRIKSINTQKVLGSPDATLRNALIAESVMISLLSWLVAMLGIWLLNRWEMPAGIEADLALPANLRLVGLSGALALACGYIAGVYPARYMVSFPPALALKGSFGLSPAGRKLRLALIGVQFVISIALIICANLVGLQNEYMRDFSVGFDKEQIMLVSLSTDIYQKHHDAYANRLKEYPGIEDVAFAVERVASQDSYVSTTRTIRAQSLQFYMILCSYNFLDVMGIPVEEGRNFTLTDQQQTGGASVIFNKPARAEAHLEAGDELGRPGQLRIIGFTGDVKFTSLRRSSDNVAFLTYAHPVPMTTSYIRLTPGADVEAAISHIRSTLAGIDPAFPVEAIRYDTIYNQLYAKEATMRELITLFSLLAILLSLTGVFSMVVFETQYRRKEIAIRKIHGSTITQILELLNRRYVSIVLVCFVIAAPVAWYAINQWLQNFAYKTPVYWWVYAFSFAIVLLATTATVTFQSWRVANANPVDSIKSD
jgi:putative ABC transport system permease protein